MSCPPDVKFDELHRCIKNGDLIGLRRDLDGGLDPNLKNRFGWTLLMITALEGRMDLLDLLISRRADPSLKNKFGDTAESLARFKKHIRAADFIAEHTLKENNAQQPDRPQN
jgi:ankyrin repeat protein